MNIGKMLEIQKALNQYTLQTNNVCTVPDQMEQTGPLLVTPTASMDLARRDGEFIRHKSGLIQLIDMYQWAGNREYEELTDSLAPGEFNRQNARVEIVDIIHFDLSILLLTCATPEEAQYAVNQFICTDAYDLGKARKAFDDLQLRKWWTTKTITIEAIRKCALAEFGANLSYGCLGHQPDSAPLFTTLAEIEELYLKKVEVNYNRVKAGYNHVANKEMGNSTL